VKLRGDVDAAAAAARSASELRRLHEQRDGDLLLIGNEFAEIRVAKVHTRNGVRLLIESPKSGQWVSLDPLELESLTWQNVETFSAMVGNPLTPLVRDDLPP
jgi:hypothetical protein